MTSNHKLTTLLQGRAIAGTSSRNGAMQVQFTDGSTMTVQTAGSSNSASTGGIVEAVRQQGTNLSLDFASGGSLAIQTAEETSCVMVRDGNNALEYAD